MTSEPFITEDKVDELRNIMHLNNKQYLLFLKYSHNQSEAEY